MDKITLKNMKFYGYHGVLPEEQEKGQYFFVDVELFLCLRTADTTDCLDDTVDYSRVYEIIKNVVTGRKFQLIEKLAGEISREILSTYREIRQMTTRVRKPQAPIPGELDWAEVELARYRDET